MQDLYIKFRPVVIYVQVFVEEATDDEGRKAITECLLSFFSAFDAETLPPPSADPHVMRNIENPLYQKDISPIFLQKVEYVRRRIFDSCVPKKGFTRGSIVSGFRKFMTLISLIKILHAYYSRREIIIIALNA